MPELTSTFKMPTISEANYSIKEIMPQVAHIQSKSRYDLAMLFCRYQEYYESPKFHKQHFTMMEFMDWYSKQNDNKFTYPADWLGFNVPSWAILEIWDMDLYDTEYDDIMYTLIQSLGYIDSFVLNREVFYVIGTREGDDDTLEHELAHALYFVNEEYHNKALKLVQSLSSSRYEQLVACLKKHGYHESTVDDEIHAYMATGPSTFIEKLIGPKVAKPFIELFEEYKQ